MTYNSLDDIFNDIDGTRAQLLARIESLSPAERDHRPEPNAWNTNLIVEHVAIIEGNMVRLVNKLLKKAEEAGVPAAADGSITPFTVDQFKKQLVGVKLEAPATVQPTGEATWEASLMALNTSRAELSALRPRLAAVDLSAATFPHPFAGPLNLYQWLVFIGMHEQRHLQQIERTLPAAGNAADA